MKKILIIGSGAMGSAFSIPCIDNGNEVNLIGTFLEDDLISIIKSNNNFHPSLNTNLPTKIKIHNFSNIKDISIKEIFLKTLGFTYLNAHVYTDTVFFLGNFSKNFLLDEKIYFGVGASLSSFIFFFLLGYLSTYFSKYAQNDKTWKIINIFIVIFMTILTIYILKETLYLI